MRCLGVFRSFFFFFQRKSRNRKKAGDWISEVSSPVPRAGGRFLLLDPPRSPRHKPCSEYLSPATTAILGRLDGVLEAVERAPHAKVYGMKVVAPSGAVMCGRLAGAYSFALSRATFDTILLRAAARAGAVVREGTR